MKPRTVSAHSQTLLPHLFRTEFSKITAVLCRHFGLEHLETAEDIASETFLTALETWPYNGIPVNPVAWLYTVAKNKARNFLKREQVFSGTIAPEIKAVSPVTGEPAIDLSEKNIADSQLQMLFAVCHPCLPVASQTGLALRILCGFGINEIANAFLTGRETVNKRLHRAREKLRRERVVIEFPSEKETGKRLDAVLLTLYLLFNEGYYSESRDAVLREDLCLEAMRLTGLLTENKETGRPQVKALLSLMCFHASRFAARKNDHGDMVLYNDQDDSKWNRELIAKGVCLLHEASGGEELSKYHIEAGIAYWHTIKEDSPEKWNSILQLYNRLLVMEYSPVAALNRTFVLSKVYGKQEAIAQAEKLNLTSNHFYYVLLGELYSGINNTTARLHFEKALLLAKTQTERKQIMKKMDHTALLNSRPAN